jgi:hypothetical protein
MKIMQIDPNIENQIIKRSVLGQNLMSPKRKENTSYPNHFRVDLQEREITNRRTTVIQVKAEESIRIETLKDSLRADLLEDRVAVHQEAVEERLVVGF